MSRCICAHARSLHDGRRNTGRCHGEACQCLKYNAPGLREEVLRMLSGKTIAELRELRPKFGTSPNELAMIDGILTDKERRFLA